MLRTVTIATLVLLNCSVWLGPAERSVDFTIKAFADAPQLERAEHFVVAGDFEAAYDEYEALAKAHPDELLYRYEFGLFCYINARKLVESGNHTAVELSEQIQEELYAARSLDEGDYTLAYEYAITMMDGTIMDTSVTREDALEAWRNVLAVLDAQYARERDSYEYTVRAAQAYTQMARVESRLGAPGNVMVFVRQARAIDPSFRIPEKLISGNLEMASH